MGELKVVQFKEAANKSVIEVLEKTLAQALDGEVAGVGIAVLRPDGGITADHSEGLIAGGMLGAVALLNYRILRGIEDVE